jgi:hypothetical protein
MEFIGSFRNVRFFRLKDACISFGGPSKYQGNIGKKNWLLLEKNGETLIFSSSHLSDYNLAINHLDSKGTVDGSERTAFLCIDSFTRGNIAHDLTDHSYRAWLFNNSFDIDCQFLFSMTIWTSTRQVLENLYGRNKLDFLRPGKRYFFKELFIASSSFFHSIDSRLGHYWNPGESKFHRILRHPANGGDKDYLCWVRNRIRSSLGCVGAEFDSMLSARSKKVFISRKPGSRREFINQAQAVEFISSIGFDVICLEDFPPDRHFLQVIYADVVAGFHGAGLTHIIGCRQGTKVIEIIGKRGTNAYKAISRGLDLPYIRLDNRSSKNPYYINIDKVKRLMLN